MRSGSEFRGGVIAARRVLAGFNGSGAMDPAVGAARGQLGVFHLTERGDLNSVLMIAQAEPGGAQLLTLFRAREIADPDFTFSDPLFIRRFFDARISSPGGALPQRRRFFRCARSAKTEHPSQKR